MADQQQQGAQPFPLSATGTTGSGPRDEEMAAADAPPLPSLGSQGLGLGSSGGRGGVGDDPMADLEQALGLAAAWFDGDEAAARWAAEGSGSGSGLGSPSGVLPGDHPFDSLVQQEAGDARWAWRGDDDAAQDAMMPLPLRPLPGAGRQQQWQAGGQEDPLGLGLTADQLLSVDGSDSGATGSEAGGLEEGGSSSLGGGLGPGEEEAEGAGGAVAGSGVSAAAGAQAGRNGAGPEAAAAAAGDVEEGLQQMHLDDIDTEPGDTVAPAAGPLSLEAALAGGAAPSAPGAAAAREPAPVPIVPVPTDVKAAEEDPLGALAAAIEADKPKFKPSPEWLKMMEAVEGELQEAAQLGEPALVDRTPGAADGAEREAAMHDRDASASAADRLANAAAGMQGVEEAAAAGAAAAQQAQASREEGMAGAAADADNQSTAAAAAAAADQAVGVREAMAVDQQQPPEQPQQPPAASLDQDRQRAFALLQPICSLLLLQRGEPQHTAELLTALGEALQEVPQAGLQQCLDYVLFPLLMMLDAAVALRQQQQQQPNKSGGSGQSSKGGSGAAGVVGDGEALPPGEAGALLALPAMSADRAVEAALGCTLGLLQCCCFQAGEGLLGLLRRLAAMLALPAGSASEEIREQALLCVSAAAGGVLREGAPPVVREALLSEEAGPLLGYLSSLLLQIADTEAQRGSSGSKAVRDAALHALLQLLSAVAGPRQPRGAGGGGAEAGIHTATEAQQAASALAFFLPGIAVGLCKALLLAAARSGNAGGGRAPVGPPASSAAAVSAVRALVVLLVACLGDVAVEAALHGAPCSAISNAGSSGGGSSAWGQQDTDMADADMAGAGSSESLKQALQQLQLLSQRAKSGGGGSGGAGSGAGTADAVAQQHPRQPPQPRQPGGSMRVERSAEWVQDSGERLHQLLSTALPPLLAHQRPAVRQALVEGCCRLLDGCGMALQPRTQEALLQLLLSAAQDEWHEVSSPARTWLGRQAEAAAARGLAAGSGAAAAGAPSAFEAASERLLLQLVEGLPGALRSGDAAGRQHAQQLTSAIQVCPPAWFAASVVLHPVRLQQLLGAFLEAFSFDASIAGMLLYAGILPAGAATSYTPGGSGAPAPAEAAAATGAPGGSGPAQQARQLVSPSSGNGSGVVLLPRMPLGLALVTTAATYEAVASCLKAAAALAAAADAQPGSSGTALRCLVDAFLSRLQQLVEANGGAGSSSSRSGGGGSRHLHKHTRQQQQQRQGAGGLAPRQLGEPETPGGGAAPWQLQAASVAAVLSELLLGASSAWQPSWRLPGTPAADLADSSGASSGVGSGASSNGSRELESLAAAVVQELVQEAIWSLQTSVDQQQGGQPPGAARPAGSAPPPLLNAGSMAADTAPQQLQQRPAAQQLGCNALLLKAALECCGTAARALGPRFAQNGRLLRGALLPMLDKLADGAQLVSSAAQAAVGSVCWWCGYSGSLRRLVAANADYVVDGMCAQLRQLDTHPRAPQLFTALLHQAGVAPELLPLLAEPARSAVQGLGILARRQQPQHVLAFLQALAPVAAAAGAVARQVLAEMRQVAEAVQERWEQRQREVDEAEAAAEAAACGRSDIAGTGARQEEIRRYFQRRQQQREQRAQDEAREVEGGEGEGLPPEEMEREEEERKVPLSAAEREQVALLRRHAHAAASLAQAVADAVSPLAMSQSLQVAVQSFGVCTQALRVLAATTEAVELHTNKIQLLTRRRTDVPSPDPDSPCMLPSVHLAWAPLMGALQDWRVSVVEVALQFLADCSCLSGSFLRKRFAQEALPQLQRLLSQGPARRNIIAPGQDDTTSPATVQRAQLAVLRCLHQVASCGDYLAIAGVSSSVSEALMPSAHLLLAAVGDVMGQHQPAPVREQATQTYVALARIDPDAAWCQLSAALQATGSTALPGPSAEAVDLLSSQEPRVPPGLRLKSSGAALAFLSEHSIAPPLPAAVPPVAGAGGPRGKAAAPAVASTVVPQGLCECGSAKLAAMLRQVEQLPAQWHKQVEALLQRP